jgi:hypothetical protein
MLSKKPSSPPSDPHQSHHKGFSGLQAAISCSALSLSSISDPRFELTAPVFVRLGGKTGASSAWESCVPLLAGGGMGGGVAVLLTLDAAVEPERRGGGACIGALLLLSDGAGEAFCAARLGAGRGGGGPA